VRDTAVSRFNPPAEPTRTVGFGKQDSARTVGPDSWIRKRGFGPDSRIRKTGFGPDSRIQKTGFGPDSRIRKPGSERTRERFDCEREKERFDYVRPSVRLSDATVLRFNSPAESACIFYGRTDPAGELKCRGRFSSPTLLLLRRLPSPFAVCASVCDHWTQRKVTVDAEKSDGKKKSDGGHREK